MHKNFLKILYFFSFYLLIAGISFAQQSKPIEQTPVKIDKYVVDKTGTLKPDEINYLMKKLVNFEKETSNQLVVYIIPSLNGEAIEEVSVRIAEENKVGQKGKDNGVLLLISMNDKKMRIEVGYGLEGALPDATALSIINNEIKPEFQKGDFYTGIDNGVEAIMAATRGEYEPKEEDGDLFDVGICGIPFFVLGVFGFIFIMILFSIIQSIFGCGRGWTKGGSAKSGAGGWWSSGSGSSWSSGSSGSSFGGFSGGGGSFGGGGASGGW